MSMFSGLTNQISGWVANKTGHGQPPAEEDPNAGQQYAAENCADLTAEDLGAEQQAGGVAGFAKGLMQKGVALKDGMKEKAAVLNPQNLTGLGSNLISGVTNLIPGRKEEEVPTPPDPNPPTDMSGEMMEADQYQYTE